MSQKWRKYSPEFRREAVKRMRDCNNIAALARELGIRRKWLYLWKDQSAAARGGTEQARELAAVKKLQEKVRRLEALAARQSLELDFFKGALRRVEERQRQREATTEPPSTSKSNK
jgi:transposase-like protein